MFIELRAEIGLKALSVYHSVPKLSTRSCCCSTQERAFVEMENPKGRRLVEMGRDASAMRTVSRLTWNRVERIPCTSPSPASNSSRMWYSALTSATMLKYGLLFRNVECHRPKSEKTDDLPLQELVQALRDRAPRRSAIDNKWLDNMPRRLRALKGDDRQAAGG